MKRVISKETLHKIDYASLQGLITKLVVKSCLSAAAANIIIMINHFVIVGWLKILLYVADAFLIIYGITCFFLGNRAINENSRRFREYYRRGKDLSALGLKGIDILDLDKGAEQ